MAAEEEKAEVASKRLVRTVDTGRFGSLVEFDMKLTKIGENPDGTLCLVDFRLDTQHVGGEVECCRRFAFRAVRDWAASRHLVSTTRVWIEGGFVATRPNDWLAGSMSPDRSSPPSIVVSAHRAHGSRDALKTIIPPLMIEMSEAAPWNFSARAEVHFCWIVRRSFNDRGDGLVLELPEDGPSCSGWSCPVETMFAAPESDESDPS